MTRSDPPWMPDQVDSLNAFQESGVMHPFTCHSEEHDHLMNGQTVYGVDRVLLATPSGWVCPCGYRQYWAHQFMADWSWKSE